VAEQDIEQRVAQLEKEMAQLHIALRYLIGHLEEGNTGQGRYSLWEVRGMLGMETERSY